MGSRPAISAAPLEEEAMSLSEVLDKWVMHVHDIVIQVWHQGTQVDLDRFFLMLHVVVELASIHVHPSTCPLASLAGVLT